MYDRSATGSLQLIRSQCQRIKPELRQSCRLNGREKATLTEYICSESDPQINFYCCHLLKCTFCVRFVSEFLSVHHGVKCRKLQDHTSYFPVDQHFWQLNKLCRLYRVISSLRKHCAQLSEFYKRVLLKQRKLNLSTVYQ